MSKFGMPKLSYDAMIGVPDTFWGWQGEVTALRLFGRSRNDLKFLQTFHPDYGIVAPIIKREPNGQRT